MANNTFTLDDIRNAADKKYSNTDIELGEAGTVRLVNVIRLPKEKRDQLMAIQKRLKNDEDADQEQGLQEILRLVAESESAADRLIEAANGDLGFLVTVFDLYSNGTELGEASASQS